MDNRDVYWGVLIPATVRDTAFFISLQSFIIMSLWLFLLEQSWLFVTSVFLLFFL